MLYYIMLWIDKIHQWKKGIYPKHISNKRFLYETSICTSTSIYVETFIPYSKLDTLEEDYTPFKYHLSHSTNKYVTSFYNLSGDCKLIIPIPRNKPFTTIKEFMDNASVTQQTYFWKKVAQEILSILKTNKQLYVSTHGLGVPYFHLRLDSTPKYYQSKILNTSNI